MKENNVVVSKSYAFALRVVMLYVYLKNEQKEYELASQVLRSGTSAGANIEEAVGAQSEKDFLSKMSIAYKELRETHYWIRLLGDSAIIANNQKESLLTDCNELLRIVGKIQVTMKEKIKKQQ